MSLNKISINNTTTVKTGVVYDISKATNQTYMNLADALGTDGINVPLEVREGGMSIKFIQTSDNKYVQYRLMSDSFNTTVANWQGVDNEPIAGSDNLVKSGGVATLIGKLSNVFKNYSHKTEQEIRIEDDNGNVIGEINPDGADFKNLKSNGFDVITEKEINKENTVFLEDAIKVADDNGNVIGEINPDGADFKNLKSNGVDILEAISESQIIRKEIGNTPLYMSSFPNITDFNAQNWNQDSDYITNTVLNYSGKIRLNKNFSMTNNSYVFDFMIGENGIANFAMSTRVEANSEGIQVISLEFSNGTIKFYTAYSYDNVNQYLINRNGDRVSANSYTISFDNRDYINKKYRLVIYRDFNWQIKLKLIDLLNFNILVDDITPIIESETLVGVLNGVLGHWHDAISAYSEVASMKLFRMDIYTDVPSDHNVLMVVLGDSITEGYASGGEEYTYGQLLANCFYPSKIKVSGRCQGQIDGVIERLSSEAAPLSPKYVMVTIGVNGGNTLDKLKQLCTNIYSINSIPILNHITECGGNYNQVNTQIDDCVNYFKSQSKEIYCVKMDIAMARNYNIANGTDPSLKNDHVHPNINGHLRMYKRIKIDCPFLFNYKNYSK